MLAQPPPALEPLTALAESLKQAWRDGEQPDAVAAIREHPDLLQYRSLVVELAYEEYCLREEAGDTPESEQFCHQFPAYRSQIREVIRGHRLVADHPELLQSPPAWPRPGDTFEQLTLVRELGRGTFARVYLATEPETGDRPVVLKLAPVRSREARTLGAIRHDHIVEVLWARQTSDFYAVCMSFVGAVTLRDAIDFVFQSDAIGSADSLLAAAAAPGFPPADSHVAPLLTGRETHVHGVARIASRLADAVDYLHQRGIVHGDLKPSNILLDRGGAPYLIDFNLAVKESEPSLRRGGTLPYMPPEQLRVILGGREEAGTAAAGDVYAFGAILFEAIVGKVPFEPIEATEPSRIAADLLTRQTAERTSLTASRRGIPRPLARLINRCLDRNAASRPSMAEVKREIDRYLGRRRRRLIAVASIGLLALLTTGALVFSANAPVAPVPSQNGVPAIASPPQTAEAFFARGLHYLKAGDTSPAMKDFADAYSRKPDGRATAYRAYCFTLAGEHQSAADLYHEAIRKYGFTPAWVHNNLAHSLIQSGGRGRFQEAIAESTTALSLVPELRAARLNRASARFGLSTVEPNAKFSPTEMFADLEAAMKQPPYTAELYLKAAMIHAKFRGTDEASPRLIAHYLAQAVEFGCDPVAIRSNLTFRPYLARPEFKRVLDMTPGAPPATLTNPYLVIPPLE